MSLAGFRPLLRGAAVHALAGRLPAFLADALLATYLTWVWVDPLWFGMETVRAVGALFPFEVLALLTGAFVWGVREDPRTRGGLLLVVPFVLAVGVSLQAPVLMLLFLWRLATLAYSARPGSPGEITELKIRHLGAWTLWLLAGVATAWLPRLGWEGLPPGLGWESATPQSDFRAFGPWMAVYFGLRALVGALDARGELTRRVAAVGGRGRAPPPAAP